MRWSRRPSARSGSDSRSPTLPTTASTSVGTSAMSICTRLHPLSKTQSPTPPDRAPHHPGSATSTPCATPGSALTVPPCHRAGTRAGVHVSCARLTRLCGSQRTLPAPVVSTVLHGCHTRLEGDATFRRWWFVDAEGEIAGKLAAKIVKVRERKGSIYSSHSFLPSACWPV